MSHTQVIRPLYIAEVERKFQREERASSGLYNAGDIGKCPRAAYYNRCVKHKLLPYIPPTLSLQWTFNQGLNVERIAVDGIKAQYPDAKEQVRFTNEADQISGVIDTLVPDVMMCEFKGHLASSWDWQKKRVTKGGLPFYEMEVAQLLYYFLRSGITAPCARLFVAAHDVFPLMDEYDVASGEVHQLFADGTSRWFKTKWTKETLASAVEYLVLCWDASQLPNDDTRRNTDECWLCKKCVHSAICANNINPLTSKE